MPPSLTALCLTPSHGQIDAGKCRQMQTDRWSCGVIHTIPLLQPMLISEPFFMQPMLGNKELKPFLLSFTPHIDPHSSAPWSTPHAIPYIIRCVSPRPATHVTPPSLCLTRLHVNSRFPRCAHTCVAGGGAGGGGPTFHR